MSRFVHLHTHSHYSLLNALPKIDELVDKAKEYGMSALALTDAGNLYGAIEFYKTCTKKGVKPILGIDAYVALRSRKDMQAGIDDRRTRLVLLAKNYDGYCNLIKLVTKSHLEGFYYRPRIDKELIREYRENLIAIMPTMGSELSSILRSRDIAKANDLIQWYKDIYGPENFYIQITRHPEIDGHEILVNQIIKIAQETQAPLIAGHEIFYVNIEDRQARDTLLLVNTHGDGSDRMDNDDEDFSFISPEHAERLFADIPEALENNQKVADMCDLSITLAQWKFPTFIVPNGLSHDEELHRLAYEGFAMRNLPQNKTYTDRLEYELKVIKNKGYAQYFLVVHDLLRYAHESGILTNIRGSVAGSLTTYLTKITNVDPIAYGLPFERFLNPERPSAPDIDMDFADNRRDEVINYARQKYGHDKVAQIGTFGTMMARGSVRDVARAMGYPYEVGDRISKLIPLGAQGFPMTIDKALADVSELSTLYKTDADTMKIIDMARKIEGCARHISVHAAGVVIAPGPLIDYVPLQYDTKGEDKIITQYDMHSVGEDGVGLLKFDFLGIRNLSILADAVERVKKIENKNIDIENIPLDDTKTFEILARGETIGLFQLNGSGMTKFLVDLKPSTIHDINAMVALYRPGPIEMIPEYIERKHDASKVKYLDPRMKTILDRSYGVITYQDDVMMIAINLAGYSWLEADKLRKAMGKKIPKEMAEQKDKLIKGLVTNGMSKTKADKLWKLIEPFAAYGFNKAHAASYGRVAYQTAYMKANFPAIYMSSVLTAESGDVEKIGEVIAECKRMGIPILPPDINESYSQFTVIKGGVQGDVIESDRIRFGLVTIKNFGQGIATSIIDERKRAGHFTSLTNFLERIKDRNLNKKSLESLIKAGALDCFGVERGTLMANIENLLAYNKEHDRGAMDQDSLFGLMSDASSVPSLKLIPADTMSPRERLAYEKELLGLYVSGHPLDRYRVLIESKEMNIKKVLEEIPKDKTIVFACIIETVKTLTTKNGEPMAFITLSDFTGSIEAVVFPRTLSEYRTILEVDRCVAVKGKVSVRNDEKSVLIDKLKELEM